MFRIAGIGIPALSPNWCEDRWVTPQHPRVREGPGHARPWECPRCGARVPATASRQNLRLRLCRAGYGISMETPGSGGAGLGDAISTETAAAPGCGRDVPGTGYRGGRSEVSARPWCEAMKTERFGEQELPLSPARDRMGRAFLSLTFQTQPCLPCPVCPALCQAEPLASVRSGGGAQLLSHPGKWSSGPFWEDRFQPMRAGGVQGHGNSPVPVSKGTGPQGSIPGIQGCSMTAPVLTLKS